MLENKVLKYQQESLTASGDLARHLLDKLGETFLSAQNFAWAQLASARGLTPKERKHSALAQSSSLMERSYGLLNDDGSLRLKEDRIATGQSSAATTPDSDASSDVSDSEPATSQSSQHSFDDRNSAFPPGQTLPLLPTADLPALAMNRLDNVEAQRLIELSSQARHSEARAAHFQRILTLRLAGRVYVKRLASAHSATVSSSGSNDETSTGSTPSKSWSVHPSSTDKEASLQA